MHKIDRAKKALAWIVGILRKHNIPFQITGGLAGIVYGSGRTLNDIDIDVPEERIRDILPDVRSHIVFGPERYKDESWDLTLLTLDYNGQSIDLGGAHTTRTFDMRSQMWKPVHSDLETAETHEAFGVAVPVVCPNDYIAYKRTLNRVIDGVPIDCIDADAADRYQQSKE